MFIIYEVISSQKRILPRRFVLDNKELQIIQNKSLFHITLTS